MEGHSAIVHTAAASNLGQMLVKICAKDGIPLVNIVRSDAQVEILKGIGAKYIVNSGADDFMDRLVDARSEEHTSELQSPMRTSYAVFCLTQKKTQKLHT